MTSTIDIGDVVIHAPDISVEELANMSTESKISNLARYIYIDDSTACNICIDVMHILLHEDMDKYKLHAVLELKGYDKTRASNTLSYMAARSIIRPAYEPGTIIQLRNSAHHFITGRMPSIAIT